MTDSRFSKGATLARHICGATGLTGDAAVERAQGEG